MLIINSYKISYQNTLLNDELAKSINECKEKTLSINANSELAKNKLNKLSIDEEKEEYLKRI